MPVTHPPTRPPSQNRRAERRALTWTIAMAMTLTGAIATTATGTAHTIEPIAGPTHGPIPQETTPEAIGINGAETTHRPPPPAPSAREATSNPLSVERRTDDRAGTIAWRMNELRAAQRDMQRAERNGARPTPPTMGDRPTLLGDRWNVCREGTFHTIEWSAYLPKKPTPARGAFSWDRDRITDTPSLGPSADPELTAAVSATPTSVALRITDDCTHRSHRIDIARVNVNRYAIRNDSGWAWREAMPATTALERAMVDMGAWVEAPRDEARRQHAEARMQRNVGRLANQGYRLHEHLHRLTQGEPPLHHRRTPLRGYGTRHR